MEEVLYIAQDVLSKALENNGKKILCNNTMLDPNADIISNKEYASITEGWHETKHPTQRGRPSRTCCMTNFFFLKKVEKEKGKQFN